jgi:hypothetical protein
MAKTSIAREVVQEGSLREGLEAAIRERVREVIELILEEEVDAALGAGRSQRVAERSGYRHGRKSRRLTLRTGTVRVEVPRARLVDVAGNEREWLNACKGSKEKPGGNFEFSALVTETLLLGNVASRTGQRLSWDRSNMKVTNSDAAQKFVKPERRTGWEL